MRLTENRCAKTRFLVLLIFRNGYFILSIFHRETIRKGLNVLRREIPGGDTFMHLGLEKVKCSNSSGLTFK